jgi:hypothetical protein
MSQRQCTLTFKLSDATTQVIVLKQDAPITPHQQIQHIRSEGGFWVGRDNLGVAAGSLWVNYEQIVSIAIS